MSALSHFPLLSPEVQEAIMNGPAMKPPKGIVPNFDNPPNSNTEAIAVITICTVLVFIFTLLRAYSRLFVAKKPRIDDVFGLLAVGAFAAMVWDLIEFMYIGGFFVHQYNLRFRDLQRVIPVAIYLPIIFGLVMLFAKTAILLEWARLFVPKKSRNYFWWSCMAALVLNAALYIISVILEGVACVPLEALWKPWVEGKCFNKQALDLTSSGFNLALDLLILLLPQKVIWSLQLTTSKKLGVSAIFSFGILTIICAAGKFYATFKVQYVGSYPGDLLYTLAPAFLWGIAECTCVIVVFCMPAIPRAFKDGWVGTRIVASVRSWTLLQTLRRSSVNDTEQGAVHAQGPEIPKAHGNASDDGSEIHLTDLQSVKSISSPVRQHGATDIVRHTKISMYRSENTKGTVSTASIV